MKRSVARHVGEGELTGCSIRFSVSCAKFDVIGDMKPVGVLIDFTANSMSWSSNKSIGLSLVSWDLY